MSTKDVVTQEKFELVEPALLTRAARMEDVTLQPAKHGKSLASAIQSLADEYGQAVVHSDSDRMTDVGTIDKAAEEYVVLKKMQDYIEFRMDEIRKTFFSTLDEREDVDESKPKDVQPGAIVSEAAGLRFTRTEGKPTTKIDEKRLAKEHPVIYKKLLKDVVIPAVEEKKVQVLDEEAFGSRLESDSSMRDYLVTKYARPQFRVYNSFSDED